MRANWRLAGTVLAAILATAGVASGSPIIVGQFNPGVVTDAGATAPVGVEWNGANLVISNSARAGEFYVASRSGARVGVVDPPGIAPGDPTWDGSALWYDDEFDRTIRRIDMAGNVLSSFDSSGLSPFRLGLAWDGNNLWAAAPDATIYQLTTDGSIVASYIAPDDVSAMVWAGNTLWGTTLSGRFYAMSLSGSSLNTIASYQTLASGTVFRVSHSTEPISMPREMHQMKATESSK